MKNKMLKFKLSSFKDNFFKSKKYWILFLVLVMLCSLSLMTVKNYNHPKMEFFALIFLSILGIILISYYQGHNNDKELYKTVFIVLLLFGLITSFVIPIDSVSDEGEHFTRAELTSRGILFPEYVNGSFKTIDSIPGFFVHSIDKTVFEVNGDTGKINNTLVEVSSAFEQNPFFGYLFSGLGIFIAKLLDLNVIWMLWLARIFNSLLYSTIVAYAIKKTPLFKMPLFFIACLPVCLFQAFSVSIDSVVAGLGILTISYFIYMYKNEFGIKEIFIISILSLLTGLCKLPYLALILLLFFLPKNNFKQKNYYIYCLIGLITVGLIGVLWSKSYATPALVHSWRATYITQNNVSIANQMNFLLSDPLNIFNVFINILYSFSYIFNGFFSFYAYTIEGGVYNASELISLFILVSLLVICFTYPIGEKINSKFRFGALLTFIVIYFGTYIVQLLSWSPAGSLTITGVHTRYFLPLFALLPIVFSLNLNKIEKNEYDHYIFVLILVFIVSMIFSLIAKYY